MRFISSPYSNAPDKILRAKNISEYSANLFKQNIHIICPMTLGLNLAQHAELPYDSTWWIAWTLDLLSKCDEMDVLCFKGWEDSIGVRAEINFAMSNKIKINYIKL